MSKQFCPFCGYKSMERVVVTLDENGNKVYRGRRKTPSAKSMTVIKFFIYFKTKQIINDFFPSSRCQCQEVENMTTSRF